MCIMKQPKMPTMSQLPAVPGGAIQETLPDPAIETDANNIAAARDTAGAAADKQKKIAGLNATIATGGRGLTEQNEFTTKKKTLGGGGFAAVA